MESRPAYPSRMVLSAGTVFGSFVFGGYDLRPDASRGQGYAAIPPHLLPKQNRRRAWKRRKRGGR